MDEMEKSPGNTGVSGELKFNLFLIFVGEGRGLEGLIESIQEKLKDALWRLSLLQFVQMTMHQLIEVFAQPAV